MIGVYDMLNVFSREKNNSTFFCFSPPVMLATFIIEIICGLYVFTTSKPSKANLIIIALLICLGIFQLAEYRICSGENNLLWMRVGYAAITLLPPLGIHLISLVTKRSWTKYLGYSLSAIFVVVFILSTHAIKSAICGGNYIMVNTGGILASSYFPIFYYALLAIAVADIIYYLVKNKTGKNNLQRNMLIWLLVGYSSFIIPTEAVYLLTPHARAGLPSIMCGFAVLLAIVLTFKVYPICKKTGL